MLLHQQEKQLQVRILTVYVTFVVVETEVVIINKNQHIYMIDELQQSNHRTTYSHHSS